MTKKVSHKDQPDMPLKKLATTMIRQAIEAVDPAQLIKRQLHLEKHLLYIHDHTFDLKKYHRIYIIGFGKGAAYMAEEMEELLQDRVTTGAVVVKYGHGRALHRLRLFEAGHPVPDMNTLKAGTELLKIARQAEQDDLVIVLITGGGSALFEVLPREITLEDLAVMNRELLKCGATIEEINALRKHLSLVKGGRLAELIQPAQCVTLILSDVIGDPLDVIASGPTAADNTTYNDVLRIIEKYELTAKLPRTVVRLFQEGQSGKREETPKPGDRIFNRVHNFIIGNNKQALGLLEDMARKHGFAPLILTDQARGEAREIGKLIAAILKSAIMDGHPLPSSGCLILGGEPTVTLRGKGKGGRNQELVLAVLTEMAGISKPFYFCSVGTDGTDGPTDAAGAWIDHLTEERAKNLNLNPHTFLDGNDSYPFFKTLDQLIMTGPTGTNVMDIMFALF